MPPYSAPYCQMQGGGPSPRRSFPRPAVNRQSPHTRPSKHTIHGDANITDDVESIRNLMNMNYDIKR